MYKEDLSLDEAKEEQKQMLKSINELKSRLTPRTGKISTKHREKIENLILESIYELKNRIIDEIQKSKKKKMKGLKKVLIGCTDLGKI